MVTLPRRIALTAVLAASALTSCKAYYRSDEQFAEDMLVRDTKNATDRYLSAINYSRDSTDIAQRTQRLHDVSDAICLQTPWIIAWYAGEGARIGFNNARIQETNDALRKNIAKTLKEDYVACPSNTKYK